MTDRNLSGIPAYSRAGKSHGFLRPKEITEEVLAKVRSLNELARARGQKLAQMALAWVLRHADVTSALSGASRIAQSDDAVGALANRRLTDDELRTVDRIRAGHRRERR